jgi:hypothetical protein
MPRRLTIRQMMAVVAVLGIVMGLAREGIRFWRWYELWSKHADARQLLLDTADAWDREAEKARRKAELNVPYAPVGSGLMPFLGPVPREQHIPMSWKEEEAYCRERARNARVSAEQAMGDMRPFRWFGR